MLKGKRIIVTGAAQGIGASLAAGFAAMGARVVLADIADPGPAAARIEGAIAVRMDVTDPADCERLATETEAAFGGIDGVVNNAALFATLPMATQDEIAPDLWDKVMAVNAKGPWLVTRACVPVMERSGGGSVVMISTNRILQGFPGMLHYDASKGAVFAITRSLIRELGPINIRVNTIMPGLTMSEGVRAREGIEDRAPVIARTRSIVRDMQPDDLLGPCAFFLSDHSAFVTGQALCVDGGGITH
jgi:NAD(P)-dependent dehydrogenase (short-subunit alcohol dehydrogenase family)